MATIVFDLETTGLNFDKDDIIQLGYLIVKDGLIVEQISDFIKCDQEINNSDIHGITTQMIKDKGITLINSLTKFFNYVKDCDLLVGHNIYFDMKMIKSSVNRYKLTFDIDMLYKKKRICTMLEGMKYLKESKWPKLSYLYEKLYNKQANQKHQAIEDCLLCFDCYKVISQENKNVKQ